MSEPLLRSVRQACEAAELTIEAEVTLPGQQARYLPPPEKLHPDLRRQLTAQHSQGLFAHQVGAIEAILDARDVCLATPTSSGKSLAFLTAAADILLHDDDARVLALYPARALVADQLQKWHDLLDPLGLDVALIHGGVDVADRVSLLARSRVILMTPDVAHAWLLSNLADPRIQGMLANLRMLVLDEAHVYTGVFATNMAYLLRRLAAVTDTPRIVCSTATIAEPVAFVRQLTGRDVTCFGVDDNGAAVPDKTILTAVPRDSSSLERIVHLVRELAQYEAGRFIVFGDSRRMVELVVAGIHRNLPDDPEAPGASAGRVLPYRAGYEEDDRKAIQDALRRGGLAGVVSTSALELGLDIGDIDLVVLLGVPSTMQSFWQRVGRAGRRSSGACLLVDDAREVVAVSDGLQGFLQRPLEPCWLYLDNRYIQYAHALAMADERRAWTRPEADAVLETVPQLFRELLANELDPQEIIPPDLYALKQQAQGSPHHQFPLRCGAEPNLHVEARHHARRGQLTWPQVLREGYPGAIYYYMGQPYRVHAVRFGARRVDVRRAAPTTTRPLTQVMVFPSFNQTTALVHSEAGFLAEVPMQVSERVIGFQERRGQAETEHRYSPGSQYAQKPLTRFFETTGVCWSLSDTSACTQQVACALADAFSLRFGVQRSDIGHGTFQSRTSPDGTGECRGMCIYDATHGSLRLTQRLFTDRDAVIETALLQASDEVRASLEALRRAFGTMAPATIGAAAPTPLDPDVVEVVVDGARAMRVGSSGTNEVLIQGHRYTPYGLMYQIANDAQVTELVSAGEIRPIHGVTETQRVNLVTGEALT